MVVVVANAEALLDQIADHRAGPDSALVSGRLGSRVDERRQLVLLGRKQLGRRTRRLARDQPLYALGLVPLQPAIYRAAGHARCFGQLNDAASFDVPKHRSTSSPLLKVPSLLGVADEPPQTPTSRCRASPRTYCLACLFARHDHSPL